MEFNRLRRIFNNLSYLLGAAVFISSAVLIPTTQSAPQLTPSPGGSPATLLSTESLLQNSFTRGNNLVPTSPPKFNKAETDTLGWNDPETCNVGVCSRDSYCTVFGINQISSLALGVCCDSATCLSRTECVDYQSHSMTVDLETAVSGTLFCANSSRYCLTEFVQSGYGYSTFVNLICDSTSGYYNGTTTAFNPSWWLYTSGPETTSIPTTTYTPIPDAAGSQLSGRSIAGISICSIITAAVCVVVIIVVWIKLRWRGLQLIPPGTPAPAVCDVGTGHKTGPIVSADRFAIFEARFAASSKFKNSLVTSVNPSALDLRVLMCSVAVCAADAKMYDVIVPIQLLCLPAPVSPSLTFAPQNKRTVSSLLRSHFLHDFGTAATPKESVSLAPSPAKLKA
ncbi:hypothetical protein K440DRAFT_679272 [Wilcoxina mikolae CBS 423.85]|nr:hypothetical protein K440DRAFT_679272 [Wilcoxina mikolae CBS 423.85]